MNPSLPLTNFGNDLEELSEEENLEQVQFLMADKALDLAAQNINLDLIQLSKALKSYILSPNIVPLSFSRKPFVDLSFNVIKTLIENAIKYPEKVGRLTYVIRTLTGCQIAQPSNFVIIEAHIDLTIVDKKLSDSLLRLGFEFDNFVKIYPEKYKHHFTLKYCVNTKHKHRARELFNLVAECSQKAANIIQDHTQADGYVETEVYSDKDDKKYNFRPVTKEALQYFPFNSESFKAFELPLSISDAQEKNFALDARRVADIHVKVPSHLNYEDYVGIESLEMNLLKDQLKSCGFYEIISEGANYIYTAHFYDNLESAFVFKKLVEFANNWGGFTGVTREICTKMWRKQTLRQKQIILAEAPPLLSLK
jgi:hypothetical protein